MVCMTQNCVGLTQSSVIRIIHHNVSLKWFLHLPKCLLLSLVFSYIYISHSSVKMHLGCHGICNHRIIANCPQSVSVKECWKSVNNWWHVFYGPWCTSVCGVGTWTGLFGAASYMSSLRCCSFTRKPSLLMVCLDCFFSVYLSLCLCPFFFSTWAWVVKYNQMSPTHWCLYFEIWLISHF